MPHLSISGLCKAFGKKKLLDGLDLAVERGECLVGFGGSGSGKTTLLRHIAGLLEPDAGTGPIDGQRAGDVSAQQRGVAMAFQNFALYPHMTAFENIASPLRARAIDEARIARQVQEVAELLRIAHVLDHSPRQLSNGQKQRPSLARSLVHKPQMILLDDPLRNVDAKIRFEMRLEFPKLFKAFGSTVLYVTQDYREALALGDRIGVLVDGRFAQIDSPAGVYRNPQSREVARLFGDPPINLFEGTPPRGPGGAVPGEIGGPKPGAAPPRPRVGGGGPRVVVPDPWRGWRGRACVLGVRPEDLLFSTEAQPGALPVTMEAAMPINVRTV